MPGPGFARRALALAAATLSLAATPARADWREASTDHFVIYADSSEGWLKGFAERLERFDAAIRWARQVPTYGDERSNRLVIYVVRGDRDAQALCGKGCGSVVGFYLPRAGASVAYTIREEGSSALEIKADSVLFHEYTHHFMASTATLAYPKWYNEGLAEYFSSAVIERDGSVGLGKPAMHRAYGLLNVNPVPIAKIFDPPETNDASFQDRFYGRSWLLTYMISKSPERTAQLTRYIALLNQGRPSLDAAKEAFGDLKLLDRELARFVDKPLSYFRIPADKLKLGAITVRSLTRGEAATMTVRMRSDRGVSREQALALLSDARRLAMPYPADAGAQAVLAEAEYDAGNDAEAEAAVDRALAVAPTHREAVLYKGRVLARRASMANTRDAGAWRAARGWYIKANKNDPDAAEPLMLFYTSHMAAGEPATANAIAGLVRAQELSPQSNELRMLTARELILAGKTREARAMLLPVAFNPHQRSRNNPAARLVERIDAGASAAELRSMLGRAPADEEDGGID